VKRLLRGDLVEVEDLEYSLGGWHLGIIAAGPKVVEALRRLAVRLDRRLLLVAAGGGVIWAWLGGQIRICSEDAEHILSPALRGEGATMAIGEPGQGIGGWRASHRQAAAALPVAQRSGEPLVRYADVALLAASLHDEVLSRSLHDLYLKPLAEERYCGQELRRTLRAYRDAGHNVSSAASALGVNRNTVTSRLRTIEEALGRPLLSCGGELDVALRLEELDE
jgi:DNA-binding PucR family transcriptional regulator